LGLKKIYEKIYWVGRCEIYKKVTLKSTTKNFLLRSSLVSEVITDFFLLKIFKKFFVKKKLKSLKKPYLGFRLNIWFVHKDLCGSYLDGFLVYRNWVHLVTQVKRFSVYLRYVPTRLKAHGTQTFLKKAG